MPAGVLIVGGLVSAIVLRDAALGVFTLLLTGCGAYLWTLYTQQHARLENLRQGLLRFKAGDFSSRVEDSKFDEFGEVVRLTNEFAGNLQKFQGAMSQVERQRQQLFADLTQMIAKPLEGLHIALNELLRASDAAPASELEPRLTAILEEILHLGALVEDLIEVSNIDSRRFRLNLKHVDVHAVLHEAHQYFEVALRRKQMKCNLEVPEKLGMRGDPERLSHVFHSLFANAIKYAGANTTIRVGAARQGNLLRLTFEDNGAGMSPEVVKKVFRRFERGETTEVTGGGLGLSVCKFIVNQHRGRVRIDSSPANGTRVLLEFMTGGGGHPAARRRRRSGGRRTG